MKLLAVLCVLVVTTWAVPLSESNYLYNDILEAVNMQQSSWKVGSFPQEKKLEFELTTLVVICTDCIGFTTAYAVSAYHH
jgi:uncharacterized lipoprotein YmbA